MIAARTLNQIGKPLLTLLIIASCIGGAVALQLPQINRDSALEEESEYIRQERVKATNLQIIDSLHGFGFDNLIADWMFLQFVQYFGNPDARSVTGYDLVPQYFQAIMERDPRFASAYIHLSSANTMFAGYPQVSINLLEESLAHLSPEIHNRAFQLWVYKATDEMLFTDNLEAAKLSYQKAQEWAEQSDHPSSEGIAGYAQRMVDFMETNPDTTEARIGAWGMILMMSEQPAIQEEAIQEIEALGGEVLMTPDGRVRGVRLPPEE